MSQLVPALSLFLRCRWPTAPGPGNLAFRPPPASRFGPGRRAVRPAPGYHLATWVVTFLIGAGAFIGGLQAAPGPGRAICRIAGAGYVLWLAWRVLRGRPAGGVRQRRGRSARIDGALAAAAEPQGLCDHSP